MEIKEAIEVLKSNYPDACYSMIREAVDIAITTMEEQMSSRSHTASQFIDTDILEKDCSTLHPIRKTNADNIRSMTDDKLARSIYVKSYVRE